MIEFSTYILFILAASAIVIVPGPTVTVIIANSLNGGVRAGLLNVAGTQVGLAVMVVVLAFGFASIVEQMAFVFDLIRVVGAAYLIWLGIGMWRAGGNLLHPEHDGLQPEKRWTTYFLQGFLVIWSNPKALFFFGAFIPQFVNPEHDPIPQVLLLGGTFMAVATLLDAAYALAAGYMKSLLTQSKIGILEKIGGTCLVGGGLWLAFDDR